MSTITLSNGKTYNHVGIFAGQSNYQNSLRRTLEIRLSYEEASFDDLRDNFIPANLNEIILASTSMTDEGEKTNQYQHLNYSMVMGLGTQTIDNVDLWVINLAQKTDLELAQEEQAVMIAEQQDALIELAALIV